MTFEPGLLVRTRVRADRIDEFTRWVRDVVESKEDLVAKLPSYRWFLPADVGTRSTEGVEVLLLAEGTDLARLDLEPLLLEAYGAARAQQLLQQFTEMLVDEQDAWQVVPLP